MEGNFASALLFGILPIVALIGVMASKVVQTSNQTLHLIKFAKADSKFL